MESFQVGESLDQKRLDVVLGNHEKLSSRSEAQKLIKSGRVQVNSSTEKITSKRIIQTGDVITFSVLPQPDTNINPVSYPLDIPFEDQNLLVVNKPRGMVVHPAVGHHSDTLVNYLLYHTNLSNQDCSRPGIVHRLDKDTSGLLVVAKDNASHENLAKQFFHRQVSRKYEAITWGVPQQTEGIINQPIGRHPVNRKKFALKPNGKRAITRWRLLKNFSRLSLIECKLETGRTHQIRVHLSSLGYSILGDQTYGRFRNFANKYSEDTIQVLKQFKGQALHAKTLGFEHPVTGDWLEFHSDLPSDMEQVISVLSLPEKS